MQTARSLFGIFAAAGPVIYCGGLLFYFFDYSGSVKGAQADGLGPTVLGLMAVGLLFCVPLILKVVRFIARPRAPGSGGDPSAPPDGGIDADAVIARYMARNPSELGAAPAAPDDSAFQQRASFGRKLSASRRT